MANQVRISSEMFVRLYMESWALGHTMPQLAARLGVTLHRAHGKATYVRTHLGVSLPKLAHGRRRKAERLGDKLQGIVDSAMSEPAVASW